jgi:hypothetical protein
LQGNPPEGVTISTKLRRGLKRLATTQFLGEYQDCQDLDFSPADWANFIGQMSRLWRAFAFLGLRVST